MSPSFLRAEPVVLLNLVFVFLINLFIYIYLLLLAVLGLHCCAQAFSSCGEQGLPFIAVRRLLLLWSTGSRARGLQ